MLGIAYAANVGGVATIIGTPPNLVVVNFIESEYGQQISFARWMIMGVPFTCLMLALIYFIMVKWVYPNGLGAAVRRDSSDLIKSELDRLGQISALEKRVLLVFVLTISLWVFRSNINDWQSVIHLSDTGISMLAALILFGFPHSLKRGEFVLEWRDTVNLPWGILILFGGGLALASGLSQAGVIDFIGGLIANKKIATVFLVTLLLVAIVLFMTEMMSNVALVAIFAPVVAGIAVGMNIPVLHMLIPIAMASSCAFMLPMATPPNAIVFASGHIKVAQMARVGIVLNIVSVCILSIFLHFIIPQLF
jgi:sodium-dependent dicarboxylate transporter 2/3/5